MGHGDQLGRRIGTGVHLTNEASKGTGGGRVIRLNRELKAALLSLRQSLSRGSPVPIRDHDGAIDAVRPSLLDGAAKSPNRAERTIGGDRRSICLL